MKTRVAVIGAGYMGGGIAQVMALAGCDVQLGDIDADTARASRERLIAQAAAYVERGYFAPDAEERCAEGIHAAASVEAAVDAADMVEEAVPEVLAIKQETLKRISSAAPPEAVIGSNTSTISIGMMAEFVYQPERFLGIHFSNPAPFIPGVEVIPHAQTDQAAVDSAMALLERCGKVGVQVKDVTGFVLNRLQYALFSEASRVVEEGVASVEDIDTIARTTFGYRLPFFGPFAIADIAGLDVYEFCYTSLASEYPERFQPPAVLTERVAAGQHGLKSGSGFLSTPAEDLSAITEYRDAAYAEMARILEQLGDPPVTY